MVRTVKNYVLVGKMMEATYTNLMHWELNTKVERLRFGYIEYKLQQCWTLYIKMLGNSRRKLTRLIPGMGRLSYGEKLNRPG